MQTKKYNKSLVIFSGGQDSLTCLYWAIKHSKEVFCIAYRYGQKHEIEIDCATSVCKNLGINLLIIDVSFMSIVVKSGLLNERLKGKNKKGLPSSFVPNRNQLFFTIAHGYAQTIKAETIVTGVCQTDASGYPDCRGEFIKAIQLTSNLGSDSKITIEAPLLNTNKHFTFKMADDLGVLNEVIEQSHTCYNGNRENRFNWGYGCGECDACIEREKGFNEYQKNIK